MVREKVRRQHTDHDQGTIIKHKKSELQCRQENLGSQKHTRSKLYIIFYLWMALLVLIGIAGIILSVVSLQHKNAQCDRSSLTASSTDRVGFSCGSIGLYPSERGFCPMEQGGCPLFSYINCTKDDDNSIAFGSCFGKPVVRHDTSAVIKIVHRRDNRPLCYGQ